MLQTAATIFHRQFGTEPEALSWAPGRVELLGNHTDYNGGFVLAVALEVGITVAAERRHDSPPLVELWSEAFQEKVTVPLGEIRRQKTSWANYALGVLRGIEQSGTELRGLRLVIESNLPVGAGISSSAALELATAEVFYALFGGRPPDLMDEAKLCQRAEVEFVGVPCGLLDQFTSLFGRKDHALFLDCDTLEYERVPTGRSDLRVVVADSGVKHELADGQYATLRRHCESAAGELGRLLGRPVRHLRAVNLEEFLRVAQEVPAPDRSRAEHVIRENERVLRGCDALRDGRLDELGQLMLASHNSSRDLFGNSCAELDYLVEEAWKIPGLLGAKLSGGGFGGATVNLVAATEVERFTSTLEAAYERKFRRPLGLIVTGFGDGAFSKRL